MQTNPAVEQSKIIRWSDSPWNQSGRKGKGLRRKGFAEEPSLEFRMKYWASKRRCKGKFCSVTHYSDTYKCYLWILPNWETITSQTMQLWYFEYVTQTYKRLWYTNWRTLLKCRDPRRRHPITTKGMRRRGEVHWFAPSSRRGSGNLERPYGGLNASSW